MDHVAGLLRVIKSTDANQVTIAIDKGIAGAVVAQRRTIHVPDAYADKRFDRSVDTFTGFRTRSILSVPVFSEDNHSVVAVLQALNKTAPGDEPATFETDDIMLLEVLSALISGLYCRATLFEACEREKQKAAALLQSAVAVHSAQLSAHEKLAAVTAAVEHGLDCERLYLYLLDEVHSHLAVVSPIESLAGSNLPLGAGVAGKVVAGGAPVRLDNAYTAPAFDASLDRRSGFSTRTVLAVPIFRGGTVVGVLEALNQSLGAFDEGHEELLAAVALQVGDLLLPDLLGELFRKRDVDDEGKQLRTLMLAEYSNQKRDSLGRTPTKSELSPLMRRLSGEDKSGSSPSPPDDAAASRRGGGGGVSFGAEAKRPKRPSATLPTSLLNARVSTKSLLVLPQGLQWAELRDWDLDMWRFSQPELLQLAAAVLEDCGLLGAFRISREKLSNLLHALAGGYHANPYHNFQHAVSVLHACYLLSRSGTDADGGRLDPLHVLSLFVAALGHDVDHPGVSNAFLINTSAPLALCYNDESVLENHHAATTFSMLADTRNDIFEDLPPADRRTMRSLVCKCILATDMAHHSDLVKQITRLAADKAPVEQAEALTAFLHLADLSNPVLEFSISRRWASLVCSEFRAQAARETELGLPVAPHLAKLDTPLDVAKLQLGFIDFVVMPLWSAAAVLFPGAKRRIAQLERNRAAWAEEKERESSGATA